MEAHSEASHPNAWEDGIRLSEKHLFGFSSLAKLENWFGIYLNILVTCGFNITCYEDVTNYIIGKSNKQLVFIPTNNRRYVQLHREYTI